ncbi:MAG: MurR/RpiR family transcriptional regulator [Chloroflexota bacterium]|nr:MurR/RpiR family transcriptional regulator [Chloroflexota bacterium]
METLSPSEPNPDGSGQPEIRATGLSEVDRAIDAHYDDLSAGQRRAIDRLLADTRYGAVVSAPQLADAIGVSESTITRAAQTLGFTGFPDLQRHLRARFVAPVQDRLAPLEAEAAETESLARHVMLDDAARIREMAEDLAPEDIEAVVQALVGAGRVLVFGERGSHGLALMLVMGLRLVLSDARLLTQHAGDVPDQLLGLESDDVVVAVSFRRVDRMTVNVLRQARSVGATAIALTDHRSSPAARAADLTLIARTGILRLMPSFAPGASLVNAILEEVAVRTQPGVAARLRDAEDLWTKFGSYAET